mgnify:FL=1
MNRNIDIKSRRVQQSVSKLDGFLRAEYNSEKNYLEYYAGLETLDKVISIKDQIIYGRRGTGKTHLLKALQEKLLADDQKYLPVYIDLRTFKPTLESDNDLYYALIIFQEIVVEVLKCVYVNLDYLYQEYTVEQQKIIIDPQRRKILALLEKFNRSFDGKSFTKMGETGFRVNEVKKLATNLKIAKIPELFGSKEVNKEIESEDEKIKYISFSDMSDAISELLEAVDIDRIFCLLDEWSEIPETSQYILAEFLKRTFVPKKVTLKIAAIPNRTQLISENRIGLEDGGDIFGFPLDNRYIYELYPEITKAFFNELLYKQLYLMDPQLYEIFYDNKEKRPVHNFINIFLANQALREILIASAGIPRDFLNIFISAYNIFFTKTNNRHLVVADIRNATVEWYGVDKKKTVDANSNAKLLLDKIINDILITKKRCHFLIPEKYEKVKELNDLIDLRVIHLRKRGISHKGNKGVVYNVYYLDYACYTSTNLYHNKINTTLLNEIETIDDFREIRRVSLEDKFFEDFNMNIGNSFKCPKCGGMIDMNHPSYAQHKICMHCWSKIEE